MGARTFEIRGVREEELDELFELRQVAYLDTSDPSDPSIRAHHTAMLSYRDGVFEGGKLRSTACWLPFELHIGGRVVEIAGLASVATAIEARRRGYVEALLHHGLKRAHERGIGWSLEYPFDTRYYHRYGWDTVANGVFVKVPVERFRALGGVAEFERVCPPDDAAIARMQEIYSRSARAYNFTHTREDAVRPAWKALTEGMFWSAEPRYTFLGEEAYVVLTIARGGAGQTVHVEDWAYESVEGRRAIFGFLAGFAGQAPWIELQLPTDDPLVWEWAGFMCPHPDPLHARIVDVEAACRGVSVGSGFEVVVEVRDDFCEWNRGVWRIFERGGVSCVEPWAGAPEVVVDVRGLARLLGGSASASAASRMGLATGGEPAITALAELSAGRASYMSLADYF